MATDIRYFLALVATSDCILHNDLADSFTPDARNAATFHICLGLGPALDNRILRCPAAGDLAGDQIQASRIECKRLYDRTTIKRDIRVKN